MGVNSLSIADRRKREKLQKRNDIIDAAEKVFMIKGFENSTMEDIAKESEYSKGTLYLYFKSKNELCLSIVVRGLNVISSKFEESLEFISDTFQNIYNLRNIYSEFCVDFPNFLFAFNNYKQHRNNCKYESDILTNIDILNEKIRNQISSVFQKGKENHFISDDAECDKLSQIYWGDLSGLIPSFLSNQTDSKALQIFEYTNKLILKALKKRSDL